jgi:hypothetical protein
MKVFLAVVLALSAGSAHAQSALAANPSVDLRDARLPAAVKQQLANVIIAELAESDNVDIANRRRIALDSQVSLVRLRRGGLPSILLQPSDEAQLCAGNGNCPSWLFLRSGNRALLVLEDHGQGISVEKTSHNNMYDLVTTYRIGHTPITEEVVQLHFDGKAYRRVSCSESTTGGDEDDTEIPSHPCASTGTSK